ncbi:hypothetical protein [Pontibacter pamirensis]|uniref:hypothetical protein n=1 Tax=Pontibacter pamirensis TaxID=2562824 RepID=UPI001389F328|nr:hypothetical protein [Pontibacter pamirensis]
MPPEEMPASDKNGIKENYGAILSKLQATVARHGAAFPQLSAIEEFLGTSLPETDRDEDCLQRLQELCAYLYELSVGSYVIRHLHHYLALDVEAVKHRNALISQEEYYLIIPR